MKMKICHLILKYEYYDSIADGRKTVEYRDNTPYWRKRLLDADRVTFHRGYTKTTITFGIRYVTFNGQIELHLGARVG